MPAPSFHRANNIIEIFVAYMLKQTLFKIFGNVFQNKRGTHVSFIFIFKKHLGKSGPL